jgi:fructokinase
MPIHPQPIVALGELLWDMLPTGPRAGGAPFNFAFHCKQLGHRAFIVSRVGTDELGQQLRAEVRRLGMSDEFIQDEPCFPTGTVPVHLNETGQATYSFPPEVAWDFILWNDELRALTQQAIAVCYGTLAQREIISRTTIRRFLSETNPDKTLRICDINLRPTSDDPEVWRQAIKSCNWLKYNNDELARLKQANSIKDVSNDPTSSVTLNIVTLGNAGCLLLRGNESDIYIPGIEVEVVDTVGAGDAFTAALLTQTLEGKSLAEAGRFANAYAALVASREGGTPIIERTDVEQLL